MTGLLEIPFQTRYLAFWGNDVAEVPCWSPNSLFFGSLLFIGDDHKPNSSSQNKPKMKIAYWWDEFIPNLSRSGLILTRVGQP